MTVELAPTGAGQKAQGASEVKGAKGKSAQSGASGSGAATGFLAVLSALDTAAVAAPTADLPVDVALETPQPDANALLSQSARWAGLPVDGALAQAVDSTLLASNSLPVTVMALDQAVAETAGGTVNATDIALPIGLPGIATTPAPFTEIKPTVATATPVTVAANFAPTRPTVGGASGMVPDLLPLSPLKVVRDVPGAAAKLQALGTEATNLSAVAGHVVDGKNFELPERAALLPNAALVLPSSLAAVVAVDPRDARRREHSIFATTPGDGVVALQPLAGAAQTAGVQTAPTMVPPTEVFVAEQVKYWMSNGVQNAELKLEGLGNNPVEVSISMNGNEAHVAFRTDELHTREMLENAGLHLKDMLEREGVSLAGVSVGTSGPGDSGAQGRKSRPDAKQTTVISAMAVPVSVAPLVGRPAGRTLDLFV
jgi:flagellar hook-length control protein FliK